MANLIMDVMEAGVRAMGSRQVSTKNIMPFHHYSAATYFLTEESIVFFFSQGILVILMIINLNLCSLLFSIIASQSEKLMSTLLTTVNLICVE